MPTNSFQRFGISHLSVSALNTWCEVPRHYINRYLFHIKEETNPAMARGTAVEAGFAAYLRGGKQPASIAYQSFDENTKDSKESQENIVDERTVLVPMLDQCLKWTTPGMLLAIQVKIEYWFDEIPIPIIGYLDFAFDGIDIDLKTTKACPSTPRPDHVRQVSLYRAARNRAGGLLYVTEKRHANYEINDEDMNVAIAELREDALSLNNYLARMETKEEALKSLPINRNSYRTPKRTT